MKDVCMRFRVSIALLWLVPVIALANPVAVDGQSLIAFAVVAVWALIIESGIATLALSSTGILMVPTCGTLTIANIGLFLFAFMPLSNQVSLWVLEPGVVLADAILIKFIASASFLQGGDYVGVGWRRVLVASALGNAASYFIGVLGSQSPWLIRM